jgi:hypothetical protein
MTQATRRKPKSGAVTRTRIPIVCDLPVPPVPPGCTFTDAQGARWEELFTSAVAWLWGEAELGLVAAYIHLEAQLFNGTAPAATVREIKALADQLGMTPASRARMGVEITDDE